MALLAAAFAALPAAAATSSTNDFSCFNPQCPITITDNAAVPAMQDQAATPYPSEIRFPHGDPCCPTIDKVTVTIRGLTHSSLDNVDILLVRERFNAAPQVVELMSDVGGLTSVSNLDLTFDQTAPTSLPQSTSPTSGVYKPTNYAGTLPPCAGDGPAVSTTGDPFPAPAPPRPMGGYPQSLDIFNGTELGGETFHLYVGDDCFGGGGSIASWSLTFTVTEPPGPVLFKSADAAMVNYGSPIGFRLDAFYFEESGFPAFGVSLDDPLPGAPGLDWSIDFGGDCSISGAVGSERLSCYFGDMYPGNPGASVHVSSPTTRDSCGTHTNTATLSSQDFSPSEASASTTVNCPTAVSVTSFSATRSRGGVLLRWRTAPDAAALGFGVYREQSGRRDRVNAALIPAIFSGRSYSRLDRRAPRGALRYVLQTVGLDGRRRPSGTAFVAS
jgi:hypothetical protein